MLSSSTSAIERLLQLGSNALEKHNPQPNGFLPFRGKSLPYDYQSVAASLVAALVQRKSKKTITLERLNEQCREVFSSKLTDPRVLNEILAMYLQPQGGLTNYLPEFLLVRKVEGASRDRTSDHLSTLLTDLLSGMLPPVQFNNSTHFLEAIVLDVLQSNLVTQKSEDLKASYLPFVQELFAKDIAFLSKQGAYFVDQIVPLIRYYNLFYCSQLALNIKSWKAGAEPTCKPLYFILTCETASMERTKLRDQGYDPNLHHPLFEVFPRLSMLEYLNSGCESSRLPLWMFAREVNQCVPEINARIRDSVDYFNRNFRNENGLEPNTNPSTGAIDALDNLFASALEQFGPRARRKDKQDYPKKYLKYFEEEVANEFLVSRGRSGKVLAINPDFLLLLTNLIVADGSSIRLHELLLEFQKRGIWFDNHSKQALISFYERVGNVDRMSDSGDAVYVRRTI